MQKMQMINDNERDFPGDVNCYILTPAGEDRWAVASERSLSGNIPPKKCAWNFKINLMRQKCENVFFVYLIFSFPSGTLEMHSSEMLFAMPSCISRPAFRGVMLVSWVSGKGKCTNAHRRVPTSAAAAAAIWNFERDKFSMILSSFLFYYFQRDVGEMCKHVRARIAGCTNCVGKFQWC